LAIGADNTLAEKIETLERGFDDYFPRGFSKDDIVAKIKALLRRSPQFAKDSILEYYDLRMDRINRMVWRASDEVELRAKEFDLLKVFLLYPEEVLSRGFIFDQVWGSSFLGDSNVIEVYIRYLRSKLGKPNLIRTKRGSGYLLISEEGQIRQASQDLET
jgi:two-component system response regulator MprA